MSLYLGSNKISDVYHGGDKIKEIYYGNVLVYSANTAQDVDLTGYTYTINSALQVVLTQYTGNGQNPVTPHLSEA